MNTSLCCPKCGEVVFKSMDSATKLRSKVLVFKKDHAVAVCKGCGHENPVPIKLDTALMKSMVTKNPRLYVKK